MPKGEQDVPSDPVCQLGWCYYTASDFLKDSWTSAVSPAAFLREEVGWGSLPQKQEWP